MLKCRESIPFKCFWICSSDQTATDLTHCWVVRYSSFCKDESLTQVQYHICLHMGMCLMTVVNIIHVQMFIKSLASCTVVLQQEYSGYKRICLVPHQWCSLPRGQCANAGRACTARMRVEDWQLTSVQWRGSQCFVWLAVSKDVPAEMYRLDARQRLAGGSLWITAARCWFCCRPGAASGMLGCTVEWPVYAGQCGQQSNIVTPFLMCRGLITPFRYVV